MRKFKFELNTSLVLGVILVLFLAVKSYGYTYSTTDENIYYYMAKLVADGKVPYRDFFLAHPPLHVFILSMPFMLFGFQYTLLKTVPVFAVGLSGVLVYRIAEKHSSFFGAATSLILFLFSYDLLRVSAHATGINLAVLAVCGGLYFLLEAKYLASGLICAFGVLCRLYVAPSSLVFAFFAYARGGRRGFEGFTTGLVLLPLIVASRYRMLTSASRKGIA